MRQEKLYKYLGTNGVIESPVFLEGIYSVYSINLYADLNKKLTNGFVKLSFVNVPKDEVNQWYEIDDNGQD